MPLTLEQTTLLQREATVERYFDTFNAGTFDETAALFADAGQLCAPFEEPIAGREAIQAYLYQEAAGMRAYPKEIEVKSGDGDRRCVIVKGQVTAIVFKVNCAWIFDLNANGEIEQVRVKLLASMQELFNLRSE
ncbi:MAG: nuclear transport factor 2 family protein [Cyanobacteria bacterium P01_C01_bin.70]